jgi:hypothetical protein
MKAPPRTPQINAELGLLYKDSVDQIAYAKRQQWQITYYISAIYGAIYGVFATQAREGVCLGCFFGVSDCCKRADLAWFILIALILAGTVSGWLLLHYQYAIATSRKRVIFLIRNHASKEFRDAWGTIKTVSENGFLRGVSFVIVLLGFQLAVCALVLVLMWNDLRILFASLPLPMTWLLLTLWYKDRSTDREV